MFFSQGDDDLSKETVLPQVESFDTATDTDTATGTFQAETQQNAVCPPVVSFSELTETPLPSSVPTRQTACAHVAYQPPYANQYDSLSGYNVCGMFGGNQTLYDMGRSAQSLPSFQYPVPSAYASQTQVEPYCPSTYDLSQLLAGPQASSRMDYSTMAPLGHSAVYPIPQSTDRQHEVNMYSVYG